MSEEVPVTRFNLMFPCAASCKVGQAPEKCSANLDISPTSINLFLLRSASGKPAFDRMSFSLFKFVTISEDSLCFFGTRERLSLFFFTNKADMKRIVLCLAECGVLVPCDFSKYQILSRPTFLPKGQYLTDQAKLTWKVGTVLATHLKGLTEDNLPDNSVFVDGTLSLFHRRYLRQAHGYFMKAKDMIVTHGPVTLKYCLRWLHKSTQPSNFGALQKSKGSNDQINEDAQRLKGELALLCSDVCEAALLRGRVYVPGNIEIAKRIWLLIEGESGIQGDETVVPPAIAGMTEAEKADLLFSSYLLMTYFFDSDKVVEKVASVSLDLMKKIVPQVFPFIWTHKLEQLCVTRTVDIGSLFSNRFPDIWRLWFWVFRSENPFKTFAAFNGSVAFMALSHLLELSDGQSNLADKWDEAVARVGLKEAMNFAQYMLIFDEDDE